MRRAVLLGVPALFVVLLGAALIYRFTWHGDSLQAARQRMQRGDMRGAEVYLRQVVRQHPDNAEAAFRLGEVDLALGNAAGAELELRRARSHGYDAQAIVLPLGQAMLDQHHAEETLREFDPQAAPASSKGYVLSVRAAAQLALNDLAAAAISSAGAEAASPDDPQVLLTAARLAVARNDLAGAASRADRVLAKDPKQAEALLLKSELALRGNDANGALAFADRAVAVAPLQLDGLLARARALAALGRDKEAREAVDRVLASSARDTGANYLRTILALRHNDYAAADASLSVLSPVLGRLPRGLYFLAITKMGLGQPAQAEEAAAKFLAQAPDDEAALRLAGSIDMAEQRPADALKLLNERVGSGHADAETLDLYAHAQSMSGDVKGASKTLANASAIAPANTGILNRIAASKMGIGQTRSAQEDLRRSLALQPAQPLAEEAFIQAALASGDTAAARSGVAELRRAVGDTEAVGVMDAQVSIAEFNPDAAEATLRTVLKRFPNSRAATLNMVRVAGLRGDNAAGEALLEDWLRRHPDDQAALGLLLPALFAGGHADRAVAVAQAAHAASPASPSATAALAAAYLRTNAPDKAVALLDQTGAQNIPGLGTARAEALVADHRPQDAKAAYLRVLEQTPGDVAVRRALAALQISAKDLDGARALLREGLRLAPGNIDLMTMLVGIDFKSGGIQAALATASALQDDPRNMPAAASLTGDAWSAAKDPGQAAKAYQEALAKTPATALAVRAASSLVAAGQTRQASDLLERWTAAHPDDLTAQMQAAGLDLAAKRLDAGAARLKLVLAAQPSNIGALNNLAWTDQQKGDLAEAAALARRAYIGAPTPEVADTLGWILESQNDHGHALPLLALGSSAPGHDQPARRYHYAHALAAAGRNQEARSQLQQALADPASFDEKADAGRLLATLPP